MTISDDAAATVTAASEAGLRYWEDHCPAVLRISKGRGFRYVDPKGEPVQEERTLQRIRELAIPPAWTQVRICPTPRGHLQATGRDDKGRKQYRYHDRWTAIRDANKFTRLLDFAAALPRVRGCVQHDLRKRGMPREKVLATVVHLLETTLIRVGNDEYARKNRSFGLTTLRNSHARARKHVICFDFRGKSGVRHCVTVEDRRMARIIQHCQEIPGQELFQYLDEDGAHHPIDSADVNDYLRNAAQGEFTAKDFRTWGATLLAARAFSALPPAVSAAESKRQIVSAIAEVASRLGHTPAVCRKSYVHPALIDAYTQGTLADSLRLPISAKKHRAGTKLTREESAVLKWLRGKLDVSR